MHTATEPTPAELDAALQDLHGMGLLPSVHTLADALDVPVYSRLLRMHARLQARGIQTLVPIHHRPAVVAPEAPHPADTPPPAAPRRPHAPVHRRPAADLFDPKRAAAGPDRDDD